MAEAGTCGADLQAGIVTAADAGLRAGEVRALEWQDVEGWNRTEMDTMLWRACRRAGLREIGWHVLRHTFCSHLAMCRVTASAIKELAGHTSLATTERYMHLGRRTNKPDFFS